MGVGSPPRFGTDGVRGVANIDITPEYVLQLGRATARVLDSSTIVVGRDTRQSSPMLEAAWSAGVASEGVDVVSVGVLATPAVAWIAAETGSAAAVITASHNPYTDNGVKVFASGGRKLPDDIEAAIEAEMARLGPRGPGGAAVGLISADRGAKDRYIEHLVGLFPAGVLHGMRLVVDCANGALSGVAPSVLSALGADLVVINASPNGCNINDRCGATHTEVIVEAVRTHRADAGFAFDGDGDRVMVVDRTGRVLDGDRLMAVVAPSMKATGRLKHDTVVVTVMTNLGFRRAMGAVGITVVETAVGDRYVLEVLERDGLSLGGEQSGHVIFRDLATTGDGLLAGLVLLDTVHRSGRGLDALASEAMTSYPQVLVNVRTARRDPDVALLVADEIAAVEASFTGGGRVLVRPSGTESLVRVMVEATTQERAVAAAHHLAEVIEARLS